jgi:hypothetical protein
MVCDQCGHMHLGDEDCPPPHSGPCSVRAHMAIGLSGNLIPEGYHIDVIEEVFSDQIIVTDGKFSVEHRWTYERGNGPFTAQDAAIEWESRGLKGEPKGWIRHQPSNRRRTYKYVYGRESEDGWIIEQEYMSP